MTKEELIKQVERIKTTSTTNLHGCIAEAREIFSNYARPNNGFLQGINEVASLLNREDHVLTKTYSILTSFIAHVQNNLLRSISLEREIQIETVSDYLEQAQLLLNDNKVHPAVPAVIIGASLEEFLRNWLEEIADDFDAIDKNIDSYAKKLKSADLINKQDLKDITAWAGIRNDAAHGKWENVSDKKRISLMLEGVNLFLRKYSVVKKADD